MTTDSPHDEATGPTQAQKDALARASTAAAGGDAVGMIEALHLSHVLDGLTRKLTQNWASLGPDDVREIVAELVAALYRKVVQGGRVKYVAAYLYRAALGRACDLHAAKKQVRVTDPAALVQQVDGATVWRGPDSQADHSGGWEYTEAMPRALAAARRLLPQLGQENLRAVMAYILDAVEAGREEVSNVEIAEALGLAPDSVRQSRFRGFQRLERLAREDRLVREDFAFLNSGDDREEEPGE